MPHARGIKQIIKNLTH